MPEISVIQIEQSTQNNLPVLHVFGRDKDGVARKVEIHGFRPYFFANARSSALKTLTNGLERDPGQYKSIHGEDVVKIFTERPGDVRNVRDKFDHLEADVLFPDRFRIDVGVKSGISVPSYRCDWKDVKPVNLDYPTRTMVVDIECSDQRGWPDAAKDPIICLTCHDSFTDFYTTFLLTKKLPKGRIAREKHIIYVYPDEKRMLQAFATYLQSIDPDVLTGWNFTKFDMPYILGRFTALRINPETLARMEGRSDRVVVKGRQIFDLLDGYKRMHLTQKESYRLDAIAKEELKEQKVRFTGKICQLDPATLVDYNKVDVELCVKLNQKDDIVNFHVEIAKYVGCSLDRTLNSMPIIDIYILRKANGRFVLPSRGAEQGEEFEGAVVFEPGTGLKENVVVLDLTSLYPMIMMTGNMSPETKDPQGEIVAPTGIRFKKHPDGMVREIQSEFLKERTAMKAARQKYEFGSRDYKLFDMKQNVIKVLMNSYYGVSGNNHFRLYDRDIGGSITSVGREILEHNKKLIEEEGYKVILGDTDSGAFAVPKEVGLEGTIAIARKMEKKLNDSYPGFAKKVLNADVSYFSVKFEKIYERFFQGGKKKRYAGLLVWKEGKSVREIDIVGYEIRRSDSPAITRLAQKVLMEDVLNGVPYEDIRREISEFVRAYRAGEYSLDEIGIPGGIGKGLSEYENPDAQVRGAIYANENFGANFGKGSKPKRLYIKSVPPGFPRTDVIAFEYGDQVPPGFVVDRELMLHKTIELPLSRIMEALGWCFTDFDPATPTLDRWLG